MRMIERIDLVEGEIEAYIAGGEMRPADYADHCGMGMNEFLRAVDLYKQTKAEKLELTREKEEDLARIKGKKRLTDAQRAGILEAIKKGVTQSKIAERFGVAPGTIRLVRDKAAIAEAQNKTAASEPVAEKVVQAIVASDEVKVEFEGDYLVVRLHKKHLTRQLLKDII